jgi:energy-coupling factor transporter ATP-binding protein EcfA2
MPEVPTAGAIGRITRVQLLNFRGFRGDRWFREDHGLTTDADLVLLAGPNGYGKTSLLDAVLLLLTGWSYHRDPIRDLISLDGTRAGDLAQGSEAQVCDECRLSAAVEYEDEAQAGKKGELVLHWDHQGRMLEPQEVEGLLAGQRFPRPSGLPESRLRGDAELEARLCGFFQDRVERLFDETTSGGTLRDVLEPLPDWIDAARKGLPELLGTARGRLAAVESWSGRSREELAATLREACQHLRVVYSEISADEPKWPEAPPTISAEVDVTAFASQVLAAAGRRVLPEDPQLPRLFAHVLRGEEGPLEQRIWALRRTAAQATEETGRLMARIEAIAEELAAIEADFPRLDEEVGFFATEHPGDPDALAIFESLARHSRRWGSLKVTEPGAEAPRLARVLEELSAVVEAEAGKCAAALADWLEPRHRAYARCRALEAEREQCRERLRQARTSEEVRRLEALRPRLRAALEELTPVWEEERRRLRWERNAQHREAARAYLARADAGVKLIEALIKEEFAPDEALMEELRAIADNVLRRFSLVDGLSPLRLTADETLTPGGTGLRRSYSIRTADGRRVTHLSTGQKAQFAVSLLAAQNLAVSHLLSHRVILLDDVTTAYDLSNLTREAILWRQLAYGCEPPSRRQVFISSHHEDMTNHLLDLLVPPEGRTMVLLRFVGWTPEGGPEIETLRVVPTKAADREARSAYAQELAKRRW